MAACPVRTSKPWLRRDPRAHSSGLCRRRHRVLIEVTACREARVLPDEAPYASLAALVHGVAQLRDLLLLNLNRCGRHARMTVQVDLLAVRADRSAVAWFRPLLLVVPARQLHAEGLPSPRSRRARAAGRRDTRHGHRNETGNAQPLPYAKTLGKRADRPARPQRRGDLSLETDRQDSLTPNHFG
jgi:hypothetical protein